MTPELIEAIGKFIVLPVCAFGAVAVVFCAAFKAGE